MGICIGKMDNNFSEKGIDIRPATLVRPSQGFWGTGEFISGEQGNKCQILRGTGNKDNIGEQGT